MRGAGRRSLQLMALAGLGIVAWFALAPLRHRRAVEPSLAQPSAERVSLDPYLEEPDAAAATRAADPAREEIVPAVEIPAVGAAPEKRPALRIYGFVLPAAGREALTEAPHLTVTDARGETARFQGSVDGEYSFGGLSEGAYWIRAGSFHDGEVREVVELESGTPEQWLDLRLLLPYELRVKVVDRQGISVVPFGRRLLPVATLEPPGRWLEESQGSPNERIGVGNFWEDSFVLEKDKLPDVYIGRLRLEVDPPVYVSLLHGSYVAETKRVEKGQREVEFVVDKEAPAYGPGRLRFSFVAAGTREHLNVHAASLVSSDLQTLRGDHGFFEANGLAPGWYEIRTRLEGFEHLRHRICLEPGKDHDLGPIPLARQTWASGRVVDEAGNPTSVRLEMLPYDRERNRVLTTTVVEWKSSRSSQEDGSFRIGSLSRGPHALIVAEGHGTWARTARLVDTSSGPVEDLRIEIVRGVPLVLRGSDERWSAVHYTILDAAGMEVVSSRLWFPDPWRVLLAPGRYVVETRLAEDGEPVRRDSITIESAPVELALP